MERPRTQITWANDNGRHRKPYDPKTRHQTSVSRRKAAGGKANKKHRFVGSFKSDRA